MRKNKIILDTDPGIDDAIAIAVLLNACKESVRLVLSSYGNTTLENTTRNALLLLSLFGAGESIPVTCGANKPYPGNGLYKPAEYVHGNDGLGGFQAALASRLTPNKAIGGDYLRTVYEALVEKNVPADVHESDADCVDSCGGDTRNGDSCGVDSCRGDTRGVDYIVLGPLTNLSALIKRYPDAVGRIDRVIVMGGCLGAGNVTPYAEFNVYCDAESANHVFGVMPDITLATLDATEKVFFEIPEIKAIGVVGTRTAHSHSVAAIMAAIMETNYRLCLSNGEPGAIMHDSTAVLAYLHPELFEFRTCKMKVVCEKERYGKCEIVEDGGNVGNDSDVHDVGNVRIITGLDPEQVKKIITDSITAL